jgi:hypothetical protein
LTIKLINEIRIISSSVYIEGSVMSDSNLTRVLDDFEGIIVMLLARGISEQELAVVQRKTVREIANHIRLRKNESFCWKRHISSILREHIQNTSIVSGVLRDFPWTCSTESLENVLISGIFSKLLKENETRAKLLATRAQKIWNIFQSRRTSKDVYREGSEIDSGNIQSETLPPNRDTNEFCIDRENGTKSRVEQINDNLHSKSGSFFLSSVLSHIFSFGTKAFIFILAYLKVGFRRIAVNDTNISTAETVDSLMMVKGVSANGDRSVAGVVKDASRYKNEASMNTNNTLATGATANASVDAVDAKISDEPATGEDASSYANIANASAIATTANASVNVIGTNANIGNASATGATVNASITAVGATANIGNVSSTGAAVDA